MIEVVIGIINKDNKLLMIKRVKSEGDLIWSFPGGKVEPSETKEEACIREVYEETGINVSIVKKIGSRIRTDAPVKLIYYLCEYISGDIRILNPEEVAEIEFKSRLEFERDVHSDVFGPVKEYIEKEIK